MTPVVRGLMVFACLAVFSAQTQSPAQTQQTPQTGLESDWDIAAVLQQLSAHAAKVLPALERADPQAWAAKGAPEAYAAQLQTSKDQARALADGAKAVAANPETLSSELLVLFREQGLETLLTSVAEAMRKYQSAESAQQLIALNAESGVDRDRLQQYIVSLAAQHEQEYQVMDEEAQRCRNQLLAPAPKKKK